MLAAMLVAALTAPGPALAAIRQQQWHLDALNVPAAQRISTGAGVTVAVIDSGVDNRNPDLSGQILPTGTRFLGDATLGTVYDDLDGHGTSVSGLIVAKGGGDDHALGVAPGAKVMPIEVLTGKIERYGIQHSYAKAIHYAVDHGAQVINISGGSGVTPPDIVEAVGYALAHNVVVVASAGNLENGFGFSVPASIPGVVAVTGTGHDGMFWPEGEQGPAAAVAAPAVDLMSTDSTVRTGAPNGSLYWTNSGTSGSAAIVSGVVALIRAKYPKLDAANVINRLVKTADQKGPGPRNPQYGFGVVDPVKALTADVPPVTSNPLGTPPKVTSSPSAGSSASGKAGAADSGSGNGGALTLLVVGVVIAVLVAGLVALFVVSGRRRRGQRRTTWPLTDHGPGPTLGGPPPPTQPPNPYQRP